MEYADKNASILMPDSINFIFCFQSKSEKELLNILKRDNFNNSVFIDKESKLILSIIFLEI